MRNNDNLLNVKVDSIKDQKLKKYTLEIFSGKSVIILKFASKEIFQGNENYSLCS